MKKNIQFIILFTFLANVITTNPCTSIEEIESKNKEILDNKKLSYHENYLENVGGGGAYRLKTKTPIFMKEFKTDDKILRSLSLLKKLTKSYKKDEFKPFTYFIGCFEKENDSIILLFSGIENESIDSSTLMNSIKSAKPKLQMEIVGHIFKFISKLGSFNPKLFALNYNTDLLIKKIYEGDKLVGFLPVANLLDNLFDEKTDKLGSIRAPEENEDKLSYFESMIYDSFLFGLMLIKSEEDDQDHFKKYGKNLFELIRTNNIKENNDIIIEGMINIKKGKNLVFEEPNMFKKTFNWFLSIFSDKRVETSYDLISLIPHVLNFEKENRPDPAAIADKIMYFASHYEEIIPEVGVSSETFEKKLTNSNIII